MAMILRTLVVITLAGCSAGDDDKGSPARNDEGSPPPDAGSTRIVDSSLPAEANPTTDGAGSDDGGMPGRGGDAGICSGFAYCEDFESYGGPVTRGEKLGPWTGSVGGPVTVSIDTVRPYSGKKSLHVVMPANTQASGMLSSPTVKDGLVAGNNLFGRAMVYFVGTAGDGGYGLPVHTHSMIFSVSGSSTEVGGPVNINMTGGGSLNYQQRKGTGFELGTAGGVATTNAWHCIQWEYDGSEELPLVVADHAQVWLDGQLVSDVPKSVGWHLATPWTSFGFGLTHLQTLENPVEFFLDDFALDGAMILCP
jgi:hypothetical protein